MNKKEAFLHWVNEDKIKDKKINSFVDDVNQLYNIIELFLKQCPYDTYTKRMICIDYTKKFGINDIKGFIKWCIKNNEADSIEGTLYHDLGGIKDEHMLPRTSGYAKYNL